ncbi:MAG: ABC-2 family transporter protein [Patescibacteria group bacterium]
MKEIKLIYRYFSNSLQQAIFNIPIFSIFLVSKVIRVALFAVFIYFMLSGLSNIGGYSRDQMIIFYLIFNLIDTSAQLLFREVYRFRPLLISGGFDMVLVKPFNPLIRVMVGGPDFIDFAMLIILLSTISYYIVFVTKIEILSFIPFLLLIVNSLIIAAAFHIFVLAIGILTLSVDHLVMIYRDLTALARIPIDVYTQPVRSLLTFIIPIGIMFTFPAKALFGLLNWQLILTSFVFGLVSLFLSLKFWNYSLKYYQSASS